MSFKRFVVRVDGVDHEVEVEPASDGSFAVRMGHKRQHVTAAPDRAWRVVSEDGAEHHTVHVDREASTLNAACNGVTTTVSVKTAQRAALEAALAGTGRAAAGAGTVSSPMPGRVVRVLVEPGAAVEPDQSLVIVEAMKMENEVRSPSSGIVDRVAVTAGDTVEAGQVLIELGPHPDST